jgi:hypothetical protein
MGVSALELRPRGAVAILDAGLRVCARSSGVWALTLPGGALVTAALLHLADAVGHRRPLALPALGFTLAWLARGIFQGAACHYLQEVLLGQGPREPTAFSSLRAALARAPSLVATVAYLLGFNLVTLGLTLGVASLLLSAHVVGYAVALRGQGRLLGLYGECKKVLGPARLSANGVRLLMAASQGLVFLNLHIGFNALFYVGRKLLGLDLTYLDRFASLDNSAWLLFLVAVTFTLFEPLRAATATLLLVDGRVRLEGLDLLAAVQRLPGRKAALLVLALLGAGLLASPAQARDVPPPPVSETSSPDAAAAREAARGILARPEFQVPGPEEPEAAAEPDDKVPEPPGLWERFTHWLGEWLKQLFEREPMHPEGPRFAPEGGQRVANVLVVLLLVGVLGVLAAVLLRSLGARKGERAAALEVSTQDATTLAADPMNALSRPPEGWAHLADELAARGEYREAVRGLYLALLSRLHREGVIHYDSNLSNWDYLRHFRGHTEWKPSFRELTLRFDFAWYGHESVSAEGYRDFRALCAPMLSPAPAPEAARA